MATEKRLIDAGALKGALREVIIEENKKNNDTRVLSQIGYLLDACPTVDAVEVVHGRYEMGIDEGDYEYGTCSVCGYNEYNAFGCCLPHNYCPNCGAKMDGKGG